MKKRHSNLEIRVEFEPNRFSSGYLAKIYEQLKRVDSRIISNEQQKNEEARTKAAIEGGEK
ncbi:MAG: hypothetical protein KZQ89_21285 [Candidatus Thiodiazotropha sp. (ex Lucinoma kastoroae)]|nr:hypothetical protein [Candidatus Thiodiazotropha sp. (ex Lucinoma kastoroae)]